MVELKTQDESNASDIFIGDDAGGRVTFIDPGSFERS